MRPFKLSEVRHCHGATVLRYLLGVLANSSDREASFRLQTTFELRSVIRKAAMAPPKPRSTLGTNYNA
jgi:hypothetical protein